MNKHKKAKLKAAREARLKEEFRDTYRVCLQMETVSGEDMYLKSLLEQFEIYKKREPKSEVTKYDMELGKYDESKPILLKDFTYENLELVDDFYADSGDYVYFIKITK